jgi:hypothetical protein
VGHPDHRRDHPAADPVTRLTRREPPRPSGKETRGPVEPRPPGATAGLLATARR